MLLRRHMFTFSFLVLSLIFWKNKLFFSAVFVFLICPWTFYPVHTMLIALTIVGPLIWSAVMCCAPFPFRHLILLRSQAANSHICEWQLRFHQIVILGKKLGIFLFKYYKYIYIYIYIFHNPISLKIYYPNTKDVQKADYLMHYVWTNTTTYLQTVIEKKKKCNHATWRSI